MKPDTLYSVGIHLLKVSNRNTRRRCKICSKLIKAPERRQWRRSGAFIVNFEHISHFHVSFVNFQQVIAGWLLSLLIY